MTTPMPRPYNLRDESVLRSFEKLESPDSTESTTARIPRSAVVCIHGILSNHVSCFNDAFRVLREDERLHKWDLCWYDYDYHAPMQANGKQLASYLLESFQPGDHVVLVCHSMGGLVARFAILSELMPFVKKAFLVGTPNLGAFRTHQLGILAYSILETTRFAHGIFRGKQGILDLTRVPQLVENFVKEGKGSYDNADHIEYITIPGMYFDTDQKSFRMERERWKVLFGGLDLQLAVVSGLPLMSCNLHRPHDGIVEAASNCMIPEGAEVPATEKTAPILHPHHYPQSSYAHIVHRSACKDATHVQILHDERIVRLLCDVIIAKTVADWHKERGPSHDILVKER
jgi:pimeloyl-ACP methyl ester carboxylesterase